MELEYYLVRELASKLGVTEKEVIHRGIRNELPIYVSRERLTSLNECSVSIEKTIIEFNGDKTFHIPAGEEQMEFFERLSIQTLRYLDIANIYDLMETVRSHLTLFDIDKGNCREISAHSHDYNNPMIDLSCLYIPKDDVEDFFPPKKDSKNEISEQTRNRIFGTLLEILTDKKDNKIKTRLKEGQNITNELIQQTIVEKYGQEKGVSKTNINALFALGKKSLDEIKPQDEQ